jgi:carbonic anhydrase
LITDDALRSLVLSQRALGTNQVMVIQHTGCGLLNLPEEDIKRDMERELGTAPDFPFGAFSDLHESVRAAVARVESSPFLTGAVAGFVYDVTTGKLHAVE